MHIFIRLQFVEWNWVHIVHSVYTSTCVCTTLPVPYIVTGSEESETDKVATTTAFEVEFAAPFVDDVSFLERL